MSGPSPVLPIPQDPVPRIPGLPARMIGTMYHAMYTDQSRVLVDGLVRVSRFAFALEGISNLAFTLFEYWTPEEYAKGAVGARAYYDEIQGQVDYVIMPNGQKVVYAWIQVKADPNNPQTDCMWTASPERVPAPKTQLPGLYCSKRYNGNPPSYNSTWGTSPCAIGTWEKKNWLFITPLM